MPMSALHTAAELLKHALANRAKAGEFAKAGAEWIESGAKTVDPSARRSICEACDRWQRVGDTELMHCTECKCLAWKLEMATSRCPLGKW